MTRPQPDLESYDPLIDDILDLVETEYNYPRGCVVRELIAEAIANFDPKLITKKP